MSFQRTDVSFVSVYQIYEFRGYVSNSLFHDKRFFLKFEFCIPYAAFVQNSSHVSGENVGTI